MIHKFNIDDSTVEGKLLVEKLKQHPELVSFVDASTANEPLVKYTTPKSKSKKNTNLQDSIPEGYISLDQFDKELKAAIDKAYGKV